MGGSHFCSYLCVLCCRKYVVEFVLEHLTLGQGPVALLLVDKDHVLKHSLGDPHQARRGEEREGVRVGGQT